MKSRAKAEKELPCKYCKEPVQVPQKVTAITCWKCTQKLVDGRMYKTLE